MVAGAVATTGATQSFQHLLDPNRKWYNNWRYVYPSIHTSYPVGLTRLITSLPQVDCPQWMDHALLDFIFDKRL